jgi:2-amino-4-hydroxy-6-hydroxymethyldihydropteridine diphosphokinase
MLRGLRGAVREISGAGPPLDSVSPAAFFFVVAMAGWILPGDVSGLSRTQERRIIAVAGWSYQPGTPPPCRTGSIQAMLGYIGLGSNVGDREEHLRQGLLTMERSGVHPVVVSSLWETEPVDGAGPDWFLNMVAQVSTDLSPERILDVLLAVEKERGRRRRYPNAPRELDLDLLLFGDVRLDTPRLTVPHPRFWSRRFVLAPLAEIAPEFSAALEALKDPHQARNIGRLALPETLPVYSPAL